MSDHRYRPRVHASPAGRAGRAGPDGGRQPVGRVTSTPDGVRDANDAFLRLAGYTRQELDEGRVHWRTLSPPEWTDLDDEGVAELRAYGSYGPHLKEYAARTGPG